MSELKESIASCCRQLKLSANLAERAMSQEVSFGKLNEGTFGTLFSGIFRAE